MKTESKKAESTLEKIARLKRKRYAMEQDKKQFGYYPELDEEEIEELEWLADCEEAHEAYEMERYEAKMHGL